MPSTTPPPLFGHTNVSRPQLQHSLSTHSVTASEDYYSLPSATSSEVSTTPAPRAETPASQYRTPMASREILSLDRPMSGPMRGDGRRRYADYRTESYPNPLRSNPRVRPVIRKPLPNSYYDIAPNAIPDSSTGARPSRHSDSSIIDDTPYIHFALDQLTRDEEVRGSRVYPGERSIQAEERVSNDTVRPSETPVSPLEPPTGGTFFSHARLGDRLGDDTPHIRPPPLAVVTSDIDAHPYGSGFDESPVSPLESAETPSTQDLPPRNPARASFGPPNPQYASDPGILLPASSQHGMPHQSLNALPPVLQAVPLAAFILILTLFLSALIFTAIWSLAKGHLWAYKHFGDNRYFTFEYLPLILAVFLLLWLFQIQIALYRVSTFIALASDTHRVRIDIPFLPLQPSGFFLPAFERFSSDQSAIACFLLASWLSLFSVPLLSAAYNVHQYNGTWMWLATQGAIWVVIALYTILLASSIWLYIYLWRRQTGLKWDPTSLADLLILLEGSNILDLYASCFYSSTGPADREDMVARDVRLGYWKTSTRPNAVIHTIAATGQSVRRYSLFNGQLIEDSTVHRYSQQTTDLESGRPCSYGTMCSLLSKRFSRQPTLTPATVAPYRAFVLRPIIAILLTITFITLLLAFLIVSYLPSTAIQSGFQPDIPIPVNGDGFSAANFLYSFVPSFLGLLLCLLWTHIDMTLRRLQPISSLSKRHGSSAEHSLLLSYTSDGPILVTIKALINRDYRVAIVSLIALVSTALPVLGGGVFWAEFYIPTQRVRIYGHMPAFHALTAIFAICCVGFLALPMTRFQSDAYSVPSPEGSHRVNSARSLADVIALVHQSKLLVDHAFHAPETRIQMVTRLLTGPGRGHLAQLPRGDRRLTSKVSLADSIRGFGDARGGQQVAGDESRYALGRYTGRDGRSQVGIDRASRIIDSGRAGRGKEKASTY